MISVTNVAALGLLATLGIGAICGLSFLRYVSSGLALVMVIGAIATKLEVAPEDSGMASNHGNGTA